jgi:hypothetical protein
MTCALSAAAEAKAGAENLSLPCPYRVGLVRTREDGQGTINGQFAGETYADGRGRIRGSHRGTLLENR